MVAQLPSELWEKIGYQLADHPPSLCVLSKTCSQLQQAVEFVVGHYEAHLHITFPKEECCNEENSSKPKIEFEMILNRKGKYRRGIKSHCHSIFSCEPRKMVTAIDDLMEVFADEMISLRFNNFPAWSNSFANFNKFKLPNCDNICFDGGLPISNGVYDMLQSCPNLKRIVISNPGKCVDFSRFWPKLKGSSIETLDLMVTRKQPLQFSKYHLTFFWDIESFRHSSTKEFKLPPSLNQLFFCPKRDVKCEDAKHLANLLYAGAWRRVYIHSDDALSDLVAKLYKPLKTVREFCFSSKTFAINYVVKFIKMCENLQAFNWYGLHSCVAPIVIARLLNDVPKSLVFGGCVACKSGQGVGNGGFMEVGNRVAVVQVTNLLERPEFRDQYQHLLDDAVLFERPHNSAQVMYIQKKDSHCGPNCIDIHEITQKAGLML